MTNLRNCRILLVDDSRTNIDMLVSALENDYKLGVASDGESALAYAKTHPLDLILLDIVMPGLDGFEVCRRLRQDPVTTNIPVIFITALDDAEDKTRGIEIGAVDYITKPFDLAEVKARVRTHLSLRLAQEALKIQNVVLEVKVKERTKELRKNQQDLLLRLGLVAEFRDPSATVHLRRISALARLLGEAAGLAEERYATISLACIAHDVGMIAVPQDILGSPGKLSRQDFDRVKAHPAIGAQLLSGSRSKLVREAETIAASHHERWDGSGYPRGLSKDSIPLSARITAICDVFDSMISERPYREALSMEQAFEAIRGGAGTLFDPDLVGSFFQVQEKIVRVAAEESVRTVEEKAETTLRY
jgi:putative two-component system response regulator